MVMEYILGLERDSGKYTGNYYNMMFSPSGS